MGSGDALLPARRGPLPARSRNGLGAQGRGHLLQLGDPDPGGSPHRLHADHVRHPSGRRARQADHRAGRREDPPLHLRQCRRGGRPVGRHLHAQHDPPAALPEPSGDLPRPPADFEGAPPRPRARGPRPRRRCARRDPDHPACASGVSRAAARAIAAGTIRSWSAAGVPVPEGGDAIALRRAGTGVDGSVEPRFGASGRVPRAAKAAFDGGLREPPPAGRRSRP